MTSDRDEIEDCISALMQMANLHSNPEFISLWNRRAALIRRLQAERDEAQTIQLARMALAFERLTILRKMWSAQEVVNWIRGDAAIEMAAAIQRDHAEARNKALDEAAVALTEWFKRVRLKDETVEEWQGAWEAILALKTQDPT